MNEPDIPQAEKMPRDNSNAWWLLHGGLHIFVLWLVLTMVTIVGPNLDRFAAGGGTQLPGIVQGLLDLSHQKSTCYVIFFVAIIVDITGLTFFYVVRPNRFYVRLWAGGVWIGILVVTGLLFSAYYLAFQDLLRAA